MIWFWIEFKIAFYFIGEQTFFKGVGYIVTASRIRQKSIFYISCCVEFLPILRKGFFPWLILLRDFLEVKFCNTYCMGLHIPSPIKNRLINPLEKALRLEPLRNKFEAIGLNNFEFLPKFLSELFLWELCYFLIVFPLEPPFLPSKPFILSLAPFFTLSV